MKGFVKTVSKIISMVLCAFIFVMCFSSCSNKDKNDTFSIVGYVWDEFGDPVEGVTVSTGFAQTETDENGKYTFSKLNGSVVVSVSKEGYQFGVSNKLVTNSSDDDNFVGYEEYVLTGTVHNNSAAVEKATVLVESLSGKFSTTTDEYGEFSISGMAGETKVSCEIEDMQFYTATASRVVTNVEINTTSSLTINLQSNEDEIELNKVKIFVNGEEYKNVDEKTVISGIHCGTIVELKSEFYTFDKPVKFLVESLNQENTFILNEIYSISGNVKSGFATIGGANILVDGKNMGRSDQFGYFEISGLSATQNVTASLAGWNFSTATVDSNNADVEIVAQKDILVFVDKDFDVGNDIVFTDKNFVYKNGHFVISNVQIGSTIKIKSELYHFDQESFDVDSLNTYTLSAYAKYNAKVAGIEDIEDYQLMLDGKNATVDELNGLSKEHTITVKYSNYEFSVETVSYKHKVATIEYKIPYNAEILVKTGGNVLLDAKAYIFGKLVGESNQIGVISIEMLYGKNTVTINCDGYNSLDVEVTKENCNREVSLSYNVTGYVKSAESDVFGAVVDSGKISTTTNADGFFELSGLEGRQRLIVSKDGFSFDVKYVEKESELEFQGTYSISASVVLEAGQNYEDFQILLIKDLNNPSSEDKTVTATAQGVHFTSLAGEYVLMCKSGDIYGILKPLKYTISGPGTYVFSSSGYKVSGYVKTGTVPIVNAKVNAGSSFVFTDSNGYYEFPFLTDDVSTISVVGMEGYVFDEPKTVMSDTENLNFNATYKVSGFAYMGSSTIEGVKVFVNGEESTITSEDGSFEVLGLVDENTLTFEKEGYQFDGPIQVQKYIKVTAHASVKISVSVQTGDLENGGMVVDGYETFVNGVLCADLSTVSLSAGDVLTFKKEGYEFDQVVVSNKPETYVVNATYKVLGKVISGNINLSDYSVYVNDELSKNVVIDDENFVVSKLSGSVKITVVKSGFVFESQLVNDYKTNLSFNGSYSVSGYVNIGRKALSLVKVTCNASDTVLTNEDGFFTFSGIFGNFGLTFEKEGYQFNSVQNLFGEQEVTVQASYKVTGVVKSGNLVISDVNVTLSTNEGVEYNTTTDENGKFEFWNVSGTASIIVQKDGYTDATIMGINDLTIDKLINMKYTFTVSFNISGVTLYINGSKETLAGKTRTFTGLEGTNEIRFEMPNTAFKLNGVVCAKYTVTAPGSIELQGTKSYNVAGYVKTKTNKIPLSGLIVSLASDTSVFAETDENGYYEIKNIAGEIKVNNAYVNSGTLNVNEDASNTKSYDFLIEDADAAYMLYMNADEKARNSTYLQVVGTGPVKGVTDIKTTVQNASSVYKRDSSKNVIRKNQNTGEVVEIPLIMTVDPNVSLAALYLYSDSNDYTKLDSSKVNVWVEKLDGKGNSTHNYTSLNSTVKAFEDTYGANPITSYLPYVINKSTINTSKPAVVSLSGSNLTFDLTLNNTGQNGYQLQIEKLAPPNTSFNSFSSIVLSFTITKDGWFSKIGAVDNYNITQTVSVKVTSEVSYVFSYYTDNDITTNVMQSLTVKKKDKAAQTSVNGYKFDIVSNLIYGN